jgi:tetratricopeptide (TPR) repeat protein
VAKGYYHLASVIYLQKGDLLKAEMLTRELLRIRTHRYGNDHVNLGQSCTLLARILMSQDNLSDETKELLERFLAINTKNGGPNGTNTAAANVNLGLYYFQLADTQQNIKFLGYRN